MNLKHSSKSAGSLNAVWYVNEFLYSTGHLGTTCWHEEAEHRQKVWQERRECSIWFSAPVPRICGLIVLGG
jgi:hypothetical protein